MTTVKGGLLSGVLLKYPFSSQCVYQLSSTAFGSKFFERVVLMRHVKLECKFTGWALIANGLSLRLRP